MTRKQRGQLDPFQEEAAQSVVDNKRLFVIADMGAGKTVIALTAIHDLFDQFKIANVLVVAPKTVAITTWPDELLGWAQLSHLDYCVLDSSKKGGRKAMAQELEASHAAITIIGVHNFRWLYENYWVPRRARRLFWRWDTVILDESTKVKARKTRVTRAMHAVSKHMDRWVNLTASPAPDSYIDLWSQAYIIDRGRALYPTLGDYRRTYFVQDYQQRKWLLRPDARDDILERLAPICLRIDLSEHLEPAEVRVIDHPIELGAYQARYDKLEQEHTLDFVGDETLVADDAGSRWGKLRQVANGTVLVPDETGGTYAKTEHSLKLDVLDEIVAAAQGENLIVIYNFKADRDRILARYKGAVAFSSNKAQPITAAWNAKKIPMLVANAASCSHGLNWQAGGRRLVFFTVPFSADLYTQTIGRIARRGQDNPVFVHRLSTLKTVDGVAARVCEIKGEGAMYAVEQIGQYLREKSGDGQS